jgi:hypothetical protein
VRSFSSSLTVLQIIQQKWSYVYLSKLVYLTANSSLCNIYEDYGKLLLLVVITQSLFPSSVSLVLNLSCAMGSFESLVKPVDPFSEKCV